MRGAFFTYGENQIVDKNGQVSNERSHALVTLPGVVEKQCEDCLLSVQAILGLIENYRLR